MNTSQLRRLGVPDDSMATAIQAVQRAAKELRLKGAAVKDQLRELLASPLRFVDDPYFGTLARELSAEAIAPRTDTAEFAIWGESEIDVQSKVQMEQACALPVSVHGALMPDAHVGYGLPIGGVLACDNAVIPYAVGVDIACRMKLSVLDVPVSEMSSRFEHFKNALENGTCFGVGRSFDRPRDHAVMDQDWTVSRVTRENRDKAWRQLGTSGSGNHFVEFGLFTLKARDEELGLDAGEYVALLSHSGSRGTGASVCSTYSSIAQSKLPRGAGDVGRLAWLSLDSQEGQEYWHAMNLMGDYAAANHDVIHKSVVKLLGARVIAGVENHHNFAWKETHDGREVIVHRKGATPAGAGVLGMIPGSMATPGYVVRGKGNAASLNSAAHGAGRRMSRKKAKEMYNFKAVKHDLAKKGIRVLAAGADEVPYVYKDIDAVMAAQSDLVEIVARFDPQIIRMCDDGSDAED